MTSGISEDSMMIPSQSIRCLDEFVVRCWGGFRNRKSQKFEGNSDSEPDEPKRARPRQGTL